MKTIIVLIFTLIGLNGFSQMDTLTSVDNLDDYVGKIIILKGEISYSKIPTILGVDVNCNTIYSENGDPNGKTGVATGILVKTVVTEVDPYTTNRGTGTFYRLDGSITGLAAEAKLLEK